MVYPRSIDHLVFRVPDLACARKFYSTLLGEPSHETSESVMFQISRTRIFFTLASADSPERYDKEQTGLNHIAFGLATLEELQEVEAQLNAAGIRHSGISKDRYGHKDYIWMDDPAGMRVEFYVRSAE